MKYGEMFTKSISIRMTVFLGLYKLVKKQARKRESTFTIKTYDTLKRCYKSNHQSTDGKKVVILSNTMLM